MTDESKEERKDRRNSRRKSPEVLEIELPPPSTADDDKDGVINELERIRKKINRLQTKFNILLYIGFVTPFWLLVIFRHGSLMGDWAWLVAIGLYSPVIFYILGRICDSFWVTKPLTPAELAYLQANED